MAILRCGEPRDEFLSQFPGLLVLLRGCVAASLVAIFLPAERLVVKEIGVFLTGVGAATVRKDPENGEKSDPLKTVFRMINVVVVVRTVDAVPRACVDRRSLCP